VAAAAGGAAHKLVPPRTGTCQTQRGRARATHSPSIRVAHSLHWCSLPVSLADLKPENIFLSGNRQVIKLGDLGVAKQLAGTFELAITCLG
jgi:serine/threonine protein kinase